MRWGPRPMVWITLPMAPAFTSSPAFTVARFSKRSRIGHRVDALRLRLHLPGLGQLLEGGHARLVGHEVLAVLHHPHPERAALVRDGCARHELDLRVLEDLALVGRTLGLGEALRERGREVVLLGEERGELAPAALHRLDLRVDVAVVQADGREADAGGPRRCGRRRGLGRGTEGAGPRPTPPLPWSRSWTARTPADPIDPCSWLCLRASRGPLYYVARVRCGAPLRGNIGPEPSFLERGKGEEHPR